MECRLASFNAPALLYIAQFWRNVVKAPNLPTAWLCVLYVVYLYVTCVLGERSRGRATLYYRMLGLAGVVKKEGGAHVTAAEAAGEAIY